jgi:hypothetical protein
MCVCVCTHSYLCLLAYTLKQCKIKQNMLVYLFVFKFFYIEEGQCLGTVLPFFFFDGIGVELRALHLTGGHSTT